MGRPHTTRALALLLGGCQIPLKIAGPGDSAVSASDARDTDGAPGGDTERPDDGSDGSDDGDDDWDPDGDSDGDGISDAVEGRGDDRDSDRDGTPDYLDEDSDDDGIPDAVEGPGATGLIDTDGDSVPDYLDPDSDGDGIADADEGAGDTDGDGVPDFRDLDADGDALADAREGTADWDGDGVPNHIDPRNDLAGPVSIPLVAISTAFTSPVGIDFHEPTASVAMSVNYPTGAPYAFELVAADGSHAPFSAVSGLTNEVKIATARSGPTAFAPGELFVGNGVDGQIVRISADGATVSDPWVDLPGEGNGLMRGSLYVDRTGAWDGDLLAATTAGELWRVDAAGAARKVADVGTHLEGLITVPDAPLRFGPLAGAAIAGAEGTGLLYAVWPDGRVASWSLGVAVEDIDYCGPGENFFGVNYGSSRILGAPASALLPMAGDVLLTQEFPADGGVGLYRLWWDGSALHATELSLAADSAAVAQWEHVTFAAAGIKEVPAD